MFITLKFFIVRNSITIITNYVLSNNRSSLRQCMQKNTSSTEFIYTCSSDVKLFMEIQGYMVALEMFCKLPHILTLKHLKAWYMFTFSVSGFLNVFYLNYHHKQIVGDSENS